MGYDYEKYLESWNHVDKDWLSKQRKVAANRILLSLLYQEAIDMVCALKRHKLSVDMKETGTGDEFDVFRLDSNARTSFRRTSEGLIIKRVGQRIMFGPIEVTVPQEDLHTQAQSIMQETAVQLYTWG